MAYVNPAAASLRQPIAVTSAPTNGTSEVQTLSSAGVPITPGTFKLQFKGQRTAALDYDATAAEVQTALRALSTIGATGVNCAGGPLDTNITITFAGTLAKKAVPLITIVESTLAGEEDDPEIAVTETTPGVDATLRTAQPATLISYNGVVYSNTSTTANAPTWTPVSGNSVELNTLAAAIPAAAVADPAAATVGADIAAFTDPPSAAEMALLRTFVNALKADNAALRTTITAIITRLETAGIFTAN